MKSTTPIFRNEVWQAFSFPKIGSLGYSYLDCVLCAVTLNEEWSCRLTGKSLGLVLVYIHIYVSINLHIQQSCTMVTLCNLQVADLY